MWKDAVVSILYPKLKQGKKKLPEVDKCWLLRGSQPGRKKKWVKERDEM